jgi:formate dehydrogenase iron-sulfur subunit
VPACPFGVVDLDLNDGKAHKCTLCYDRLKGGFEPACAKACPTNSIQFGPLDELQQRAAKRVKALHQQGLTQAYLYGTPNGSEVGPLHAFFLLTDRPEVYNLPVAPKLPSKRVAPGFLSGVATMAGLALATALVFRGRG